MIGSCGIFNKKSSSAQNDLNINDRCSESFMFFEKGVLNVKALRRYTFLMMTKKKSTIPLDLNSYMNCLENKDALNEAEESNFITVMSNLEIKDQRDLNRIRLLLKRELISKLRNEVTLEYLVDLIKKNYKLETLYAESINDLAFDKILSMVDFVGNESLPEFYQNSFNDNREEIRAYYRKNADLGHVVYLERRYIVEQIEMFMKRGELMLKE